MYFSFLSVSREQWYLNIVTCILFQPRKYEQNGAKHKQAFFGFVGYNVHTATLNLNSFEHDNDFKETE